jgi:hypothetical protein
MAVPNWGTPAYQSLVGLLAKQLPLPSDIAVTGAGAVTFTWTPVLSAAELVTYGDLEAMAKSTFTASMTLAEYQAIKPHLASEVAWQAITRNAFVNMTDGDMRRAVYDIITAEVRIARAQRRDG